MGYSVLLEKKLLGICLWVIQFHSLDFDKKHTFLSGTKRGQSTLDYWGTVRFSHGIINIHTITFRCSNRYLYEYPGTIRVYRKPFMRRCSCCSACFRTRMRVTATTWTWSRRSKPSMTLPWPSTAWRRASATKVTSKHSRPLSCFYLLMYVHWVEEKGRRRVIRRYLSRNIHLAHFDK